MTIDTQEVWRYVETQVKTFKLLPFQSDFNRGIIEGLNLVKAYINMAEEREGRAIAKGQGEPT